MGNGPWYTVQEGDSVSWLAGQFGLTVEELLQTSPQAGPDLLSAGAALFLPWRGSLPISLTLETVPPDERLESLARARLLPPALLAGLNRWTSPAEAYTGSPLVLPAEVQAVPLVLLPALDPGQALLELAASQNQNPWLILAANQASSSGMLLPGSSLVGWGAEAAPAVSAPKGIARYELDPLPLVQGVTVRVRVQARDPAALSGRLDGRELHFFQTGENEYVALQGVHAMAEPGLADFSLTAVSASGQVDEFGQSLLVISGDFLYDPPLTVDPATIDPASTGPEGALVASITAPATPEKYWEGAFVVPVERWNCTPSAYGSRRSFNGSDYIYFHGGLDYGLCANPSIFAPAPGVVVYTGSLTVRGNATIIDHGWGIYSGIWHQSEIYVREGDRVERGQLIGKIGATGRVTGEHLHWEVWAGGVQVNPLAWLGQPFP
jgi:murein DD-endopeptidase MepM/ murein hydrolase activator NlpD